MPGAKALTSFFFIVLTPFFTSKSASSMSLDFKANEEKNKTLITLFSTEFKDYTKSLYYSIDFSSSDTLEYALFQKAMHGFTYLKQTGELSNDSLLTVIDFRKHSNTKRLWVLNLKSGKVVFNELVSHGRNTGNEYAQHFSNGHSTYKSSLGFYVTGATYFGKNDLSLKLNGLEPGFNSNAYTRGIVIHGADYVSEQLAKNAPRIGRSYGCPAVRQSVNKELVNTLKGGSCLFIYHPTPSYINNSKIINSNLYLTVDELSI
jgi:hypothetical protein